MSKRGNGDIANIPIQKIKAKHIKYYLKTITIYANSTIEKIYQLLGQTFRRAIKLDDIDENYLYVSQTMTRDENNKTILGTKTKTSKSKRPITINITIKQILDSSLNEHIKNKKNLLFCDRNTKEIIKPYEVNSYLSRLNKKTRT